MSDEQEELKLAAIPSEKTAVNKYEFEPIQGYPILNWRGKRPFRSTEYFPAQLREVHGPENDGWRNKIYWGDNLQVMSHLLKNFRGKVDLVYIDPPFDSKADYKKKISLKGNLSTNDQNSFEEKQYTDIWNNDGYLQFVYERTILIKELLSSNGSLFFHCDYKRSHYIKLILDEIFGTSRFKNEIIWQRTDPHNDAKKKLGNIHDVIFWYGLSEKTTYNFDDVRRPLSDSALSEYSLLELEDGRVLPYKGNEKKQGKRFKLENTTYPRQGAKATKRFEWRGKIPPLNREWIYDFEGMEEALKSGELYLRDSNVGSTRCKKKYLDENQGILLQDIWTDTKRMKGGSEYPTQKPEDLLSRIIKAFSKPNEIVLDCFMGSGTTQVVSMKLGRRFIGADINLGAIQTTTKRLLRVADELQADSIEIAESIDTTSENYSRGFEVYNVNHYELFRNPLEAKELLISALEVHKLEANNTFDGEKDGRMVKIMPVNRIATKADLNDLISDFDYKAFDRRQTEKPNQPVANLLLICMGHEADLAASLQSEVPYKLDIEVVDILRDKSNLEFKRDAEAEIAVTDGSLIVKQFFPMNLLQKLSLQKENVEDWRELVESIMVDWNYDGAVLSPTVVDLPDKNELVSGKYAIPEDAGTIRVKITDLLSESLEMDVPNA